MDASTKYQLTVTLNELYVPNQPASPDMFVLLSFKGQVLRVLLTQCYPETPSVVKTQNVAATNPIHVELRLGGTVLGAVDCTLRDLLGEGIAGDVQQWVKIPMEEEAEGESPEQQRKVARVNLSLSMQKISQKAARSPIKKVQTPVPSAQKTRCPFLERLSLSDESDAECKPHIVLERIRHARLDMAARLTDREGEVLPVQKLTLTVESSSMLRELAPHIEVDLPNIQEMKVEQMSNKDFDKVKLALLALSDKASLIASLEQEVKLLRAQAQANAQARVDLEQTLTETTEQLRRDAVAQDQVLKTMQEERSNAVLALHEKHVESKKFEEESEVLRASLAETTRSLAQSKLKEVALADVKSENDQLRRELSDERKVKRQCQEELEKLSAQIRAQAAGFAEELARQAKLREALQAQVKEREAQQDQLRAEITALKVEIVTLNAQISTEKSLKTRLADLEAQCKSYEARCGEMQNQLQSKQTNEQLTYTKYAENEARLVEEKKRLHESMTLVETELEVKEQTVQELTRQLHEAKHNVATLEQLCCNKEDLHQLVEQLTAQNELHKRGKDALLEELSSLSEQSLVHSQSTMEQTRLLNKYAEMCESQEEEMDEMKLNVLQLQHRASVYAPTKDDPVDMALAEFVNSRSKALLVPFQRQDRDLYLFGTRRIFMKLENGRITVRVGGGFTRIEDFVEIYTPIELERTHARLAQSINGPKKVLGKLMSSVVGKTPMSPQKAAKIIASAVEKGSTKYGTLFGVRKPSPKKSSASSPTKVRTPSDRKSFPASDIPS